LLEDGGGGNSGGGGMEEVEGVGRIEEDALDDEDTMIGTKERLVVVVFFVAVPG